MFDYSSLFETKEKTNEEQLQLLLNIIEDTGNA